jgi:hypothetical protein
MLSLAILATQMIGVTVMMRAVVVDIRNTVVAQHMSRMMRYAADFTVANYTTLLGETGAVGGTTIRSFDQIQTANYIPAGFQNANAFGQGYVVMWRQISTGVLEGIVHTYGTRRFGDGDMQAIAQRIGASGGFISSGLGGGIGTNMTGTGGGWVIARANYAAQDAAIQALPGVGAARFPGSGAADNGKIVANISFENLTQSTNFLYRVNVGNPELNTMRTTLRVAGGSNIEMAVTGTAGASSLIMNQNASGTGVLNMNDSDITQARQVDASDVTLRGLSDSLARTVRQTRVVAPNAVVNKADVNCARGNMTDLTPRIDVAAMSLYDTGGRIWSGEDVYAVDNGATWSVVAQLLVPSGTGTTWVDADTTQSRIFVALRCQ